MARARPTGRNLVNWAWQEWMDVLDDADTPNVRRQVLWQICHLFGVPDLVAMPERSDDPATVLRQLTLSAPLPIRVRAAMALLGSAETAAIDMASLDAIGAQNGTTTGTDA